MGAFVEESLAERVVRQQLLLVIFASRIVLPQASPAMDDQSAACGSERIALGATHPDFLLKFPADFTRDLLNILADARTRTVVPVDLALNRTVDDTSTPDTGGDVYRCHWMITTDSRHKISADFEFESDGGYSLTAEDDLGFITNCTRSHCFIESVSPALSLQFVAQKFDSTSPVRFTARLYSTFSDATENTSEVVTWWIVLLIFFAVLFTFTSIIYLFYMKRKLLLARIFRLLSNSEGSSKAQSKKKLTLANGTQVPVGSCRRQHRTSVTSSHLSHFEPMPTITEEDVEVGDCEEAAASYLAHSSMRQQQPAY